MSPQWMAAVLAGEPTKAVRESDSGIRPGRESSNLDRDYQILQFVTASDSPMTMQQTPSRAFTRLVHIMATLRGPNGCPWDHDQTLESLTHFVLEEAYEVVDAIERSDLEVLKEEIGDHIFEGVFLAQIASELGAFDVADALETVCDKLVRRHPHVFDTEGRPHDAASRQRAPSADVALSQWDAQKAEERRATGKDDGALSGLPRGLPALLLAYKLGKRAAGTGFDWPRAADVIDKIEEEITELREALAVRESNPGRAEEELGDLLFTLANLSRKLGIEPEAALRRANAKFRSRFTAMEQRLRESGRDPKNLSLEELEEEWQAAKAGPRDPERSH